MTQKKSNNLDLVLFISLLNGWSVFLIAFICTLIAIPFRSISGVSIGLAITAAGLMEIKGRSRLKAGQDHAVTLLMGSQLLFFMAILAYSVYQLCSFDAAYVINHIPEIYYEMVLKDVYSTYAELEKIVKLIHHIFYISVIIASFMYQGGLLVFYKVLTKSISNQVTSDQ